MRICPRPGLIVIAPLVGSTKPWIILSCALLPQPLAPIKPTRSEPRTLQDTDSSTCLVDERPCSPAPSTTGVQETSSKRTSTGIPSFHDSFASFGLEAPPARAEVAYEDDPIDCFFLNWSLTGIASNGFGLSLRSLCPARLPASKATREAPTLTDRRLFLELAKAASNMHTHPADVAANLPPDTRNLGGGVCTGARPARALARALLSPTP
mmetsp:Transcript_88023/g.247387  ORF Transcript_88023/g.247387 Transcript_88023/m.247387 type:complete len:210 (+) Transcript_88023:1913-2542(+)